MLRSFVTDQAPEKIKHSFALSRPKMGPFSCAIALAASLLLFLRPALFSLPPSRIIKQGPFSPALCAHYLLSLAHSLTPRAQTCKFLPANKDHPAERFRPGGQTNVLITLSCFGHHTTKTSPFLCEDIDIGMRRIGGHDERDSLPKKEATPGTDQMGFDRNALFGPWAYAANSCGARTDLLRACAFYVPLVSNPKRGLGKAMRTHVSVVLSNPLRMLFLR